MGSDEVFRGRGAPLGDLGDPVEGVVVRLGRYAVGVRDLGAAVELVVAEGGGSDERIRAGRQEQGASGRIVGEAGLVGGAEAGRIDGQVLAFGAGVYKVE